VAALWAGGHGRGPGVPRVVCASGRFVMNGVVSTIPAGWRNQLRREGAFSFGFKRRGKEVTLRVDQEELALFTSIPMATACRSIPNSVSLLCVHCTGDSRVPVGDVAGYVNHVSHSQLHLIPGGSHEYKEEGISEELYQVWKAWATGATHTGNTVGEALRGAARL
jgi:hypothetical protein